MAGSLQGAPEGAAAVAELAAQRRTGKVVGEVAVVASTTDECFEAMAVEY